MITPLRCKCGYNLYKLNNLYYCKNCNLYMTSSSNLPIMDTDLRKYALVCIDSGFALEFRQLDILKMVNSFESIGLNYYHILIKNFIKKNDQKLGKKTLFDRNLPRVFLRDVMGVGDE